MLGMTGGRLSPLPRPVKPFVCLIKACRLMGYSHLVTWKLGEGNTPQAGRGEPRGPISVPGSFPSPNPEANGWEYPSNG